MVTRDDLVEVTTVEGFEGANMLKEKERGGREERKVSSSLSTESSDGGLRELTLQSFRALWLSRGV